MSAEEFAAVLMDFGFVLKGPVVPDGRWHRCQIEGDKAGTRNGAYVLNQQGDRLWGTYRNWKTGETLSWNGIAGTGQLSRVVRDVRARSFARVDFEHVWDKALPADPAHPYLRRKGVQPFGIRQSRRKLLIPVRTIDGRLVGLQRITADGEKRFYKGSKKQSAFHRIGDWGGTLLIAEGYATAASCYMATKMCTVVAFDADNLKHVGRVIRTAFPYARLVFAADDDDRGRQEAERAREIAGGFVLNPKDIITKGIK